MVKLYIIPYPMLVVAVSTDSIREAASFEAGESTLVTMALHITIYSDTYSD